MKPLNVTFALPDLLEVTNFLSLSHSIDNVTESGIVTLWKVFVGYATLLFRAKVEICFSRIQWKAGKNISLTTKLWTKTVCY